MISKVVYLAYIKISSKIIEDFYINELKKKNIKVEYWDLSSIFFKKNKSNNQSNNNVFYLKSYFELKNFCSDIDIKNTLVISTITYNFHSLSLYYLLNKYNFRFAFFARGAIPHIKYTNLHVFNKLLKIHLYPSYFLKILKNKISFLFKKYNFTKKFDLIYFAGKSSLSNIGIGYEIDLLKAKLFKFNYFDLDKTLEIEGTTNLLTTKYCLFHDEYLPYHPDFFLSKTKTVEPEKYYCDLNNFFNQIEQILGVEVVISAHPKAESYRVINPFNNRKLFFGQTAELCKYSEFSLLHASSSVGFAVIYEKPIIFLTSNQISKCMFSYNEWINCFADELGYKALNISKYKSDSLKKLNINKCSYENYKYNYLTSNDTESTLSFNIFFNSLSNI